jgi:protoporphyrin/coproporphyrin ferrochelatase
LNPQSNSTKLAVLLLAHGSPDSVDEVPEFLRNVTNRRPVPAQVIEEVKHRYISIGRSPLNALTLKQGELLSRELGTPVYVGMRNWKPYIADIVARMEADRVSRAVVVCLAPQNSRTSVGLYRAALGNGLPFRFEFIDSWHDHPFLIKAFAEKLKRGRENASRELGAEPPVILTAHSVPQRTIAEGDPYEKQSRETAALVASEARLSSDEWKFAFQSQGMSGGAWVGPTVENTILEFKKASHRGVFVQPIGFLCDHVEVLYDIDIGFMQFAEKEGMRLWRAESLNDSPLLIAALADLARKGLASL